MIFMTRIENETEKLREWLRKQNISAVKRATGIGRTTIYRFMNGDKPTLTVLSELARYRESHENDGNQAA